METHPSYNGFDENISIKGEKLKGGFLPGSTRVIVMGTFPPPDVMKNYQSKSIESFFYYNSPKNHFWNRIESFIPMNGERWKYTSKSKESIEVNIIRKKALCESMGLGFMDYFSKIERKKPDSYKDDDLIDKENVIENGFFINAITALPKLKRICCVYQTSYNQLTQNLDSHLTKQREVHAANGIRQIYFSKISLREIEIVLLFPATRSGEKKEKKNEQYKYFLN